MPIVEDVYDEETVEAFKYASLRECIVVAQLATDGVIPQSELPRLHHYLSGEQPALVSEAMRFFEEADS